MIRLRRTQLMTEKRELPKVSPGKLKQNAMMISRLMAEPVKI